ncbi:MAG: 16S rRNA (guanine(527)-N(7))-methyltransferase RsmG [Candidatus Moranbacteria bacterium]|nr:16S rRNA (guanine(527)-N(7))-methyltransferase RsmG [Candidatus Moranbacteria bacterium]
MELILKYFPELSEKQKEQFEKAGKLYLEWNEKINLISRKDIENLYERHILNALAIAKIIDFKPGTRILDLGTGGGFPGIPLAICFPKAKFILVDSVGKKIKAIKDIIERLELKNIEVQHLRGEEVEGQFDFVVGRAVCSLDKFAEMVKKNIRKKNQHEIENGILYFGETVNIQDKNILEKIVKYKIENYFSEEYFKDRKVLYLNSRDL